MKTITQSIIVALGLTSATYASLSYTEDFNTDGDLVTNYAGWQASGNGTASGFVTGGVLVSSDSDGWDFATNAVKLNVTATQVAGTAAFDVSSNLLTYSANLTGNGGVLGGHTIYVALGDSAYVFFPLLGSGAWGTGTPMRNFQISNTVGINANEAMGASVNPVAQNGDFGPFDTVAVSIIQNGANFDTIFTYDAASNGVGVDYSRNVSLTSAQLGTFNTIGFGAWGASDGSIAVDSISIIQVPEPSSSVFLGFAGIALAIRRRK